MSFESLAPQKWLLPNGIELHGVREGQGQPLIFIHGAMGDWRSWGAQWSVFTKHFDCISYSRRFSFPNQNHQASPHHSALDEAQDLALLIDHLELQNVVLVGSSYGGFTALALAVKSPDRIQAVVAVEPPMMKYAYFTPEGREIAAQFRATTIEPANLAFRSGDDEKAAKIMTGGINGATSQVSSGAAMDKRLQNLQAMKMIALSTDEFPLIPPDQLAALPMPILLLSGLNTQPVHRAIFDNVVAAMPNAKALRVEGAGHGVSREQAGYFNKSVLAFLGLDFACAQTN
ncbi:MAG: Esterase YbfF [Pseudomonadota bacterium]